MCECLGTTQPFLRYTWASMSWSPVIRRRDSFSCSSSRGISSQRYQVAACLALTTALPVGVVRELSGNVGGLGGHGNQAAPASQFFVTVRSEEHKSELQSH